MIFEDPRRYIGTAYLAHYCFDLYKEYGSMAMEMYEKFTDKLFPGEPKCNFQVDMIGPVFNDDTYQNGIFYPPMVIRIYLFNISISAWDGCIEMHRNDIDKVMRATLAYTILHEISHSRQNTYVPTMLYNAMEYANDRNVWDNFVPAVELILKRNYKIDIYKDRVDTFVGKVYSYPYSQVSAVERLINAFLYNCMVNGENILPEDQRRIDETKTFIGTCKNVRVELTINGVSTEAYIKVNGTYDQNAIYQCLELFKSLRYRFCIMANIDHNEVKDIAILKFKFAPPRDYNPITKIDETEWE